MKNSLRKAIVAIALVSFGVFLSFCVRVAWIKMYPNGDDPKNMEYVLWTHGLNQNMNLDNAVDAMTHDGHPERLVIGLSEEQIRKKFGYIRTESEAPDVRGCYPLPGDLVYLRRSRWVVVLKQGRAVDLVLCKG